MSRKQSARVPKWALILALVLLLATTALSRHEAKAATDCGSVTEIPVAECQALVALYTSTNGPNWTYQENWLVTNTPCSWSGVTCESGEHVTIIYLAYNRLSGGIPAEIGNLSSLQSLSLVGNQLSGDIPAEIGNLSNLQSLSLVENQLSSLPAEIGNLSSLQFLDLHENQLSSIPVEIGNLSSLEYLDLSVNFSLAGPLPASLLQLSALQNFFFDDTTLCEPGDAAFQAWLANITTIRGTNVPCGSPAAGLYMPLITTEQ